MRAQDVSNGANNFYVSDQVTVRKVTVRNQYRMTVAGNLFIPKTLDRSAKHAAIIVGHPMGLAGRAAALAGSAAR